MSRQMKRSTLNRKIKSIIERIKKMQWRKCELHGAGWYLYRMLLGRRKQSKDVIKFLDSDNLELLYATLDAWGMNSRGAQLEDFSTFKKNILACKKYFKEINEIYLNQSRIENLYDSLENLLKILYENLRIMRSESKLISHSKLLHFLFPRMLMPIDGKHTLTWLYGNDGKSLNKYLEVIKFSFDVMQQNLRWTDYLNDDGNANIPKLIDNVIWKLAEE